MHHPLTALLLVFAAALFFLVPAGRQTDASNSKARTKVITLRRTACYGTCPIYELTIYSDGLVEYVGEQFVKKIGRAASKISRKQLEALVMEFTHIYYFNLPSSIEPGTKQCPQAATDHPSAITSINWRGKSHTINHYHGCRASTTGALLRKLEDKIDTVVHVKQWTK